MSVTPTDSNIMMVGTRPAKATSGMAGDICSQAAMRICDRSLRTKHCKALLTEDVANTLCHKGQRCQYQRDGRHHNVGGCWAEPHLLLQGKQGEQVGG